MGDTETSTVPRVDPQNGVSIPSQVRSILVDEIGQGLYQAAGRLPPERLLAERFGVSRTSIRECLKSLVDDGILVRHVGRGTFFASDAAKRGGTQKLPGHLAFLIGENIFRFVQPGYTRILIGAEQVCRQVGYRLLFHSVGEEETDPQLGLRQADPGISGALVTGGLRAKTLERIAAWEVPIVMTDLIIEGEKTSAVGADYASGTQQALSHLAHLGHTRIGFIGFPNSEKYQAYWRTLERLELAYNPHLVQFLNLPDLAPGIIEGFHAMQTLLKAPVRPTAILATNDLVAIGAIEALQLSDIRVPGEISVIGYDDLGENVKMPLTTIQSFPEEVGRIAAHMLIDKLAGRATNHRVALPTELVIRETTAPPSMNEWGARS